MNENIQKLMKQAFTGCQGEQFDPEKFALLIVRECAALVPAEQSHAPNGQSLLKIFEEHFGVEP